MKKIPITYYTLNKGVKTSLRKFGQKDKINNPLVIKNLRKLILERLYGLGSWGVLLRSRLKLLRSSPTVNVLAVVTPSLAGRIDQCGPVEAGARGDGRLAGGAGGDAWRVPGQRAVYVLVVVVARLLLARRSQGFGLRGHRSRPRRFVAV